MTLESGKEMDKKCVLDWLNKVYISPSVSYSQYTDDKIRIFAHDTLVLLKKQKEEIRQLRLALDIAKGTCNGIKVEKQED